MKKLSVFILASGIIASCSVSAKTVKYEFDIDYKTVNYTGLEVQAMAIDGRIPAPTIHATVGDILKVTMNNKMDVESSVHWHGILLPNDQDGVPGLTTPPIKPGESLTYQFPVTHSGTYWYHSHSGLQEQRGLYGGIVFHPSDKPTHHATHERVIVFSDWTDTSPETVLTNLKKSEDYYARKKDSVQSWAAVIGGGMPAIKNRLEMARIRMPAMDISDVGYDFFFANGTRQMKLNATAGDTVKLRLINGSASSYLAAEFSGGPMTVIAADGIDIEPIKVRRLRLAIAETYDVIVQLPANNTYEFRANSEDGTGYSSILIGNGTLIPAPDMPRPNFLLMHSSHNMEHGMKNMPQQQPARHSQQTHLKHKKTNASIVEYLDNYNMLRATAPTTLPVDAPVKQIKLALTGNMEDYTWSFNNKTLSEADKIIIRKGEVVQFVMTNTTMMNHPIHLHGHFFRVLNGQGAYSPLKHTVSVDALETTTIEFLANAEKDWFFHCHNLYHMASGMARIVRYQENDGGKQDLPKALAKDTRWFFSGDISALTNMTAGVFEYSNTRNEFENEFDYGYDEHSYDIDFLYRRKITQNFAPYVGIEFEREEEEEHERNLFIGVKYVLPFMIDTKTKLLSNGEVELKLSSELQLTKALEFEWFWDTEDDYRVTLAYEVNKNFLITGNYDADFEGNIGLRFRF